MQPLAVAIARLSCTNV